MFSTRTMLQEAAYHIEALIRPVLLPPMPPSPPGSKTGQALMSVNMFSLLRCHWGFSINRAMSPRVDSGRSREAPPLRDALWVLTKEIVRDVPSSELRHRRARANVSPVYIAYLAPCACQFTPIFSEALDLRLDFLGCL